MKLDGVAIPYNIERILLTLNNATFFVFGRIRDMKDGIFRT